MAGGRLILNMEEQKLVLGVPTATDSTNLAHIGDMNNPHSVTLEQARTAGSSFAGDVDMAGNFLRNVPTPSLGTDAVNKDYVDIQVGAPWTKDEFFPAFNGQISFVLSQTPQQPSSFELTVNGIEYDDGVDYTLSGMTVTWLNPFPLKTTDKLIIQYK